MNLKLNFLYIAVSIRSSDSTRTLKELPLNEDTHESTPYNICIETPEERVLRASNETKKRNITNHKKKKESTEVAYDKNSSSVYDPSSFANTTNSVRSMSDRLRNRRYYLGSSGLYGGSSTALPLSTVSNNSSSTSSSSRGVGGVGGGRYRKSSTTAAFSALDRLYNNLSPVASYYKPLLRSFGKGTAGDTTHAVSIFHILNLILISSRVKSGR